MKCQLKKLIAILSIFAMLLSLCACGDNGSNGGNSSNGGSKGKIGDTFVFCDRENSQVKELGNVKNEINIKEIYDKIDYIPEMLYGEYGLETYNKKDGDKVKNFQKDMDYVELNVDGDPVKISTLPFEFVAGKDAANHTIAHIPGFHWMKLSFYNEKGDIESLWAAYSIDGNTIKLNWLKDYEYIEEKHVAKYLLSDIITEYTFEFNGTQLTLSTATGSKSITLTAKTILDNELKIEAHIDPDSEPIDDIESFDLTNYIDSDGNERSYATINFAAKDGETYGDTTSNVYAEATKDGLFTISYQKESDDGEEQPVVTHQFAYFLTGGSLENNLILTDGEKVYKYNVNDRATSADGLGGEEVDLSKLSQEEIAELNAKKENLLEDLVKAFDAKGIKVAVNQKTGELAMDSSVLFGGDSSVLSNEGKAFLNKFIEAYTSIVYSDKYAGFIAKTKVEGHTAPVAGSTYESGLPLSEARAKVVKDYCLSVSSVAELKTDLEDIGYSNTKPISDKKGNIDMAASRRVSFRFIVNIEK